MNPERNQALFNVAATDSKSGVAPLADRDPDRVTDLHASLLARTRYLAVGYLWAEIAIRFI